MGKGAREGTGGVDGTRPDDFLLIFVPQILERLSDEDDVLGSYLGLDGGN